MKVDVNKNDGFKPITFNITCETPEELFALWYRFNIHYNKVISNSKFSSTRQGRVPTGIVDSCFPSTYPAFDAIDEVVCEYLESLKDN